MQDKPKGTLADLIMAYRMRWKRRRLLFRVLRKRRQITALADRTASIRPGAILAFCTVRNEAIRLPFFLDHHRALGVDHFLMVDNGSDDGTLELLKDQPDISLWTTPHSYRLSRFGVDWLGWLQMKHGHGHWCLTLDADELFLYPHHDSRTLSELTAFLDATNTPSMGALMLDMYPRGALNAQSHHPGQNPVETLPWFDAGPYSVTRQPRMKNLWVQGGPRARMFFADRPERAPTMNKIPLVRWNRRHAYVSSTHSMLPPRLNDVFAPGGPDQISGVLLHTKFLPGIDARSAEEKARQEHFANSALYDDYYDRLTRNPDLWCEASLRYESWHQLEALGLMSRGSWD